MSSVYFKVPAGIANQLLKDGDASRPQNKRGAAEITSITIDVIGVAADSVTLVLAQKQLREGWAKIVRWARRQPRAEKLNLSYGDVVDISVNLNKLPGGLDGSNAQSAMRAIVEIVSALADPDE